MQPAGEQPQDQHPTDPTVAVAIGVDGFELGVEERGLDHRLDVLAVGADDEVVHEGSDLLGRWRNEGSVVGTVTVAANPTFDRPVRRPPEPLHRRPAIVELPANFDGFGMIEVEFLDSSGSVIDSGAGFAADGQTRVEVVSFSSEEAPASCNIHSVS